MKKKTISLAILSVFSVGCLGLGAGALTNEVTADAQATSAFKMVKGASVRVVGDGYNGIRFSADLGATLDATAYTGYTAEESDETGFFVMIIPYDYLDTYNLSTDYYGELYDALYNETTNPNPYIATIEALPYQCTQTKDDFVEGNWYINGSLTTLKYGNLNREFFGIAYWQYTDGTEVKRDYATFVEGENVRTHTYVASMALNDEDVNPTHVSTLQDMVKYGINQANGVKEENKDTVLATPLQATVNVENNAQTTLLPTAYQGNVDVDWTYDENVIECIDENGKITFKGYGETTVSAKIFGTTYTTTVTHVKKVADFGDKEISNATFDFSADEMLPQNATLKSVTFTKDQTATPMTLGASSYANGVLTLDKSQLATVWGQNDIQIVVTDENENDITVSTSALMITSKIMDKAGFDAMKTLAQSANNGGYFILGANIEYNAGTGTILNEGFSGTFDGRGHYVNGVKINNYHIGIFGRVFGATIKNVSFTNGECADLANAFLTGADVNASTVVIDVLENVYIESKGSGYTIVGGYIKSMNNVVIVDKDSIKSDWVFVDHYYQDGRQTAISGLLVIGNTNRTYSAKYANATYADAYAKGTDYSGWDKSFWTVNEGCLPYPNKLTTPTVSVDADETVNLNSTLTVQTDATSVLSIKEEIEGVTINGNVVTIANDETLLGTSFTIVATSMFDGAKTAEQTVKILSIKEKTVANLGEVDLSNSADITITLDEAVTGELTSVKLGDTVLTDFTNGSAYDEDTGVITLKKADIPLSVWGEQAIEIVVAQENAGVLVAQTTVKTNALFVTMYVNSSNIGKVKTDADSTVEDYNNIHVFGGYFKLTENLMNIGDNFAFAGMNTYGEFIGVVDGNGYKISTNLANVNYNGVFGYLNNATIKNIAIEVTSVSNVTAVYWGRASLIENIYIKATVNSDNTNPAVIGGGLYNTTFATVMRNVFIDVTMKDGVAFTNPAIDLDEKPTVLENVIVVGNATKNALYKPDYLADGTNCQVVADASSLTSVDASNWNATYWTVTNGLPVWNTKTNS